MHQRVDCPRKGTQVNGQQVGVRLPIFNFRLKSSKFPISISFTNPLRKTIYHHLYLKLKHQKKFTLKTAQNVDRDF